MQWIFRTLLCDWCDCHTTSKIPTTFLCLSMRRYGTESKQKWWLPKVIFWLISIKSFSELAPRNRISNPSKISSIARGCGAGVSTKQIITTETVHYHSNVITWYESLSPLDINSVFSKIQDHINNTKQELAKSRRRRSLQRISDALFLSPEDRFFFWNIFWKLCLLHISPWQQETCK